MSVCRAFVRRVFVCMCDVRSSVYMYVCRAFVRMYVCVRVFVRICMYVCMYVFMCAFVWRAIPFFNSKFMISLNNLRYHDLINDI